MSDRDKLRALSQTLTGAAIGYRPTSNRPSNLAYSAPAKRFSALEVLRFLLTATLGAVLTGLFTLLTHNEDTRATTRNNAIAAVTEISDLISERRERAVLVASAIRRNAPESQVALRKSAYDEAYIKWNTKVPGDILRMRAGLPESYRCNYQRYIDGMTNASILALADTCSSLMHPENFLATPGILSILDACVTRAADTYTSKIDMEAIATIQKCAFFRNYNTAISCFASVSEVLYDGVAEIQVAANDRISEEDVINSCLPVFVGH